MLAKRIIPCLDIADGRVVKGVNFINLRDAGDPVEVARRYDDQGADELAFLDIRASIEKRSLLYEMIERVADLFLVVHLLGAKAIAQHDPVDRLQPRAGPQLPRAPNHLRID